MVTPLGGIGTLPTGPAQPQGGGGPDLLGRFFGVLEQVNGTIRAQEDMVVRAAAGEEVDLHELALLTQQVGLELDLLSQVRDKLVDGVNEILLRTQV